MVARVSLSRSVASRFSKRSTLRRVVLSPTGSLHDGLPPESFGYRTPKADTNLKQFRVAGVKRPAARADALSGALAGIRRLIIAYSPARGPSPGTSA